jgi:hypothetical protein
LFAACAEKGENEVAPTSPALPIALFLIKVRRSIIACVFQVRIFYTNSKKLPDLISLTYLVLNLGVH